MKLAEKLAGTFAEEQPLRQGRINFGVLAVLTALAWLGGCSDAPSDPCSTCPPPPQGLIVSADSVAYVSLPSGAIQLPPSLTSCISAEQLAGGRPYHAVGPRELTSRVHRLTAT